MGVIGFVFMFFRLFSFVYLGGGGVGGVFGGGGAILGRGRGVGGGFSKRDRDFIGIIVRII